MKITIDIPDKFINDYTADRFKDFFSRVAADIDNDGLCGNYEKETAEMFLKAFGESGRETNADRIRNMSDEELVEFIHKMEATCLVDFMGYADKDCEQAKISCNDCKAKAPTLLEWLQSEAE